jgi:iron complex transport system substrate-binding protein
MAPQISVEAVLQADPDVILNTSVDTQSPGLIFWQRYPALKAVRHRHLYALNPDWLDRPGPRFIDGVKTLCEAMEKAR